MSHDYSHYIPEPLDDTCSINSLADDLRRSFEAAERHRTRRRRILAAAAMVIVAGVVVVVVWWITHLNFVAALGVG